MGGKRRPGGRTTGLAVFVAAAAVCGAVAVAVSSGRLPERELLEAAVAVDLLVTLPVLAWAQDAIAPEAPTGGG